MRSQAVPLLNIKPWISVPKIKICDNHNIFDIYNLCESVIICGWKSSLELIYILAKDEKFRQRFGGFRFSLYLCRKILNDMKKELGKWLMDISKYITTAVVLSSIFGGITETWKILILGFITISASIVTGLLLIRSSEKEEKQNK